MIHQTTGYTLHDNAILVVIQTAGDLVRVHSPTLAIQANDEHTSVIGVQLGDQLMPIRLHVRKLAGSTAPEDRGTHFCISSSTAGLIFA